jgi:hypothetical protein
MSTVPAQSTLSIINQLVNGRSVAVVSLLFVLYGAYDLIKSGAGSIDKANASLVILSRNVEELKISIVRLTDTMEIVKDTVRDHETRLRILEQKRGISK